MAGPGLLTLREKGINDVSEHSDHATPDQYRADIRDIYSRLREVEAKMPLLNRLDHDFYNHAKDGLLTAFTKFVSAYSQRVEDREKSQKRHDFWLTTAIGVIMILVTYIAVFKH